MTKKYIESCLALYDLKVNWHYYDPNQPSDYNHYFLEEELKCGLKIKIRSDAYYIFDFSKAPIGRPVEYDDLSSQMYIINERLELIHAFLACIRSLMPIRDVSDMDFIDNFIVCSKDSFEFDKIVNQEVGFSTEDYMKLCRYKWENIKKTRPVTLIDNSKILKEAFALMDKIMLSKKKDAIYILGILYRVAVYHKLGLEMHAVMFLRSVFEWLAKKHHSKEKDLNPEDYNNFLASNGIIKDTTEYKLFERIREHRNDAVHKLIFPKFTDQWENPVRKMFGEIQKIYCTTFGIEIDIPLGQCEFHAIEVY